MLASEDFSRIRNLLTERPVAVLVETSIIRTRKEFVRFTVVSGRQWVDEEVMRGIWCDVDEELGISQVNTRRRLGLLDDIHVFLSETAYMWLHLSEFARK